MRQACKVFHSNSSYFVYFLYVLKKKRLRFCSVTFNLFLLALLFQDCVEECISSQLEILRRSERHARQ